MKVRLLPVLLALSALASGETLVLRNFTLIDGTGRAPVANAGLVITDGRIAYAGPAAGLKAPAGAATTDLGGKFIMPGIINLHCHLGNVVGLAQDPKFFTKENVNSQLDTYAKYGVTSVLSMGSDQPVIWNMRAEQRAGRPRRARIFTALRGFAGKGGYPTTVPGMKGVPYEVASPAEVEADMNDLAPKHPDVVKVWVDDHLGKEKKIPTPITAAIIKAAKKHGLNTCAHIFYYDDAKALAENGLYA
ncbi:MAG: amidohydrolase family protein, partial [Bryobacterales bacterium]|nr:amidohydrolase family protein [Bryobacterales bacterium]